VLSAQGAVVKAVKIGGFKAEVEKLSKHCTSDGVRISYVASAGNLNKSPLGPDVLLVGATTWGYSNDSLEGVERRLSQLSDLPIGISSVDPAVSE